MKKLCFDNTEIDSPVRLYQTGKDQFVVEYGSQVKEHLTYSEAARELGACLMHAMACVGRIKSGR